MPPAHPFGSQRRPPAPRTSSARHTLSALAAHASLAGLLLCSSMAWAASGQTAATAPPAAARHTTPLPPAVTSALRAAALPPEALALWIAPAQPDAAPWLAHQHTAPFNPASTLKLVTSFAALDLLGPGHLWRTEVYSSGDLRERVLHGNLYLRGGGDPALVTEKLWLLLRRVQALGIERIAGDIVLDRHAFAEPEIDPAAFNDEPLRAYNAGPDALLVNFRAQVFAFTPDVVAGVARIRAEPPLAGVQVPATVPLSASSPAIASTASPPPAANAAPAQCGDWRAALRADFSHPLQPRFHGSYPAACGVRHWPLAHPEPRRMAERAVHALWLANGGTLGGQVREGSVPVGATERLVFESPTLAEVVRDANKFSNNVMAQHLLLALNQADGPATFARSRQRLQQWWLQRFGPDLPLPEVGNGSGLSRDGRASALALGRLLQQAYASHAMPDLVASLPASGLDGTLRRSRMGAGLAHLKTGSLRDVQALAGYVHRADGQRLVLVALVNHPNAHAARPALDALVQWAASAERPASR